MSQSNHLLTQATVMEHNLADSTDSVLSCAVFWNALVSWFSLSIQFLYCQIVVICLDMKCILLKIAAISPDDTALHCTVDIEQFIILHATLFVLVFWTDDFSES